jgi:hypothetical protein
MNTDTEILRQIVAQLAGLPSALRQHVADELWARIPVTVDESAFQNLAAAGVLTVTPQFQTYEMIESVVAIVPTGATGTVQLGATLLPVGAGVTVITPVRKMLGSSDVRSLTIAGGGGPSALWLTGTQAPTFGVIG